MKKINIFGSTGIIGRKTIDLIHNHFPEYKINYLLANNNYKLLCEQANKYNPKYVGIFNKNYYFKVRKLIKNKKIKIFCSDDCYLIEDNVDLSVLAISGISALKVVKNAIIKSKTIGIVNKECLVSSGKFIMSISKRYKTKIYPLDSEHYSIYNFLSIYNNKYKNKIKKITLTASGGPFLNKNINSFKNIKLKDALKHPTWKMGFKNTIDSSTMVNKCLEIIEVHYLFNFEYSKIDILIHPESYVHSLIKVSDGSIIANIFNNDMSFPIFNCLNYKSNHFNIYNNIDLTKINSFTFKKLDRKKFKVLDIFDQINKNSISEIIVFNTANEFAVESFIKNKIDYIEITKYIKKALNKFEYLKISNINEVIDYQNYIYNKLIETYN